MYDELSLDTVGDKKTALFLIMSDTDPTFNFLISMIYTQLFNLLCEKADDVYGGRLPVHVRCLIDECANIGQIHSIGIVEINDKGDSWRIVWGLAEGARPTSEFPSHFMNHSVRKAATNGANRVIYYCHATNVIALTYILPLTDRDFTRALWQSATECPVVFPEGVGVCPWMVPGGADIAMATSEKMKSYQAAVWAQHGLFASGTDFDITFGLAHTIEKSAEIYVKVLSMGGGLIRQTITDDDLRAIARDFGVTLNENFLN